MGAMKQEQLARHERECAECGNQEEGERTEEACDRCGEPKKLCAGCAADETHSNLCDYCQHVMDDE